MKKLIAIIITVSLMFFNCSVKNTQNSDQDELSISVSSYKPLLLVDDHVSEGFLAPLKNGKVLLVFRLDPGVKGNHVGTDAYIAKISYDPENDEWGKVETVYNSYEYDDRNIHGGVTKEGRIVAFFRRYDGKETEGRYFIYSDNDGQTWSEPKNYNLWSDEKAVGMRGNMSTGRMFYNPDIEKYLMLGFFYSWDEDINYTSSYRSVAYSQDGTSWEEYSISPDKSEYRLNEIAGAWCGKNRVIALQRDDDRKHGHPFVQTESYDNGKTWTEPVQTNIPPNLHWGAAPQLIYDHKRDLLIAMGSDRYSRPNEQNSLFIYTARPDEVLGNPKGWTLQHELRRPFAALDFDGDRPLNFNFYGYSTIAPINDGEYLVVFTERSKMHETEQADLFYFRLVIN